MSQTPAENALSAAYQLAKQELEQQPVDDKGACIVLSLIEEDMLGHAYGSPEMWAKMLFGVAERNEDFRLAMHLATCQLSDAFDNDLDY